MERFYIQIYGCLFNYADAERIKAILERNGFKESKSLESADFVILVTCSVREKAEHKVMGWYDHIKNLPQKPKVILTGCMVRRDYIPDASDKTFRNIKRLGRNLKWVDVFLDITNIEHLPEIINELKDGENIVISSTYAKKYKINLRTTLRFKYAVQRQKDNAYLTAPIKYTSEVFAYVPIMSGCNEFCTYCVVPHTRGPEVYRDPQVILTEVRQAINNGKRIIYLLGQIVDRWQYNELHFVDILRRVADVPGDFFVGFISPHPKYMSKKTLELIADHPKVMKNLGLPLQSGSNRVLNAMNRKYTREEFLQIAKDARKIIPDLFLTTDVIVGYPPENDQDFLDTIDVIKQIQFDKVFFAKYSPRLGKDRELVHTQEYQKEVSKRFDQLNELTQKIFAKRNQMQIGKVYPSFYVGDKKAMSIRNQVIDLIDVESSNLKIGDKVHVKILGGGRRGVTGEVVKKE